MYTYEERLKQKMQALRWQKLHIDPWLLLGLSVLATIGLMILYSASNQSAIVLEKQAIRLAGAFCLMFIFAQIPPQRYKLWAPYLFGVSVALLLAVLLIGKVDMGARRWLSLGFIKFQPSEIIKLVMPMMMAWYCSRKQLPPSLSVILIGALIILIPFALIAKQPDLGTAIIVGASGFFVLVLAGIQWQFIGFTGGLLLLVSPIAWHFMHSYQKNRILTFLNPERDPLGSGYHIIQSKIAVGSGGFLGKGWLNGTQSHLSFLPEHSTDFIFAVAAEEFGFLGCVLILLVFLAIFARCFYISIKAQDNFTRLVAGSLSLTFALSAFINLGMVLGIMPVVGVPLPLISYGGSSLLTMMISFGIIMSIHTHRRLWSSE